MIVFSAILPHPPLSIPGVGSKNDCKRLANTGKAFAMISRDFWSANPETVIFVSPHGKIEPYHFVINKSPILVGDFSRYHLSEKFEFYNDLAIVDDIFYACDMNEIPVHGHYEELDHGTFIPLWHLYSDVEARGVKLVHISFSLMDMERHFEFGKIIGNILDQYYPRKRIAVIASADLSHKITFDAPAGYLPGARYFDRKIIEILQKKDTHRLIELKKSDSIEAAECGLRSIVVILGILDGHDWKFDLLSYEHPFGVGHLVGRLL